MVGGVAKVLSLTYRGRFEVATSPTSHDWSCDLVEKESVGGISTSRSLKSNACVLTRCRFAIVVIADVQG